MDIIEILNFFGITADKLTPIIIVIGLGFVLLLKYYLNPIKKDMSDVNKDLTTINNATCEIQSHIADAGVKILHSLTMKPGSPWVLTEYGEKLVKESGFPQVFEENRDRVIDAVKARHPQTNYDIQEYSKDVLLEDLIDDPIMKPIKDYAYQKSIDVKLILEPAALVIRDEVIKELNLDK